MSCSTQKFIGAMFIFGLLIGGLGAAEDKSKSEEIDEKHPFKVKLIDELGKPVEGATAGVSAFNHADLSAPITDDDGWHYLYGGKSTEEGVAAFEDGGEDLEYTCVVARHPTRELAGILKIDSKSFNPEKASGMLEIVMHPACRVSGRLTSSDLTKRGREVGWTRGYLNFRDGRAFGLLSTDLTFHYYVPPGDYVLDSYGGNIHSIETKITVKQGQRELILDTFEIPATSLALLEGLPAPELIGIEAWKNGPPVTLASLKGKCVVLDFWGYWCGACVGKTPQLFQLYDKYHDQGLEVIGIHVDSGEDEETPVDTVKKLDDRLTTIRKEQWRDRDLPYPVALTARKPTPYRNRAEKEAPCPLVADFGVVSFPTLVLIDKKGNVVGGFHSFGPQQIELLEKLLKD